jgi:outer membrane biosynthesis protein TonB
MKRCLQCNRTFGDENSFCLIDGSTLVSDAPTPEMPTIVRTSPFIGQPVQPVPARGINPAFIYLAVGLFALLIGGGIVALIKFAPDNSSSTKNETSAKTSPSAEPKSTPNEIDEQKEFLKTQQERLELEKQKLADERKALENKKKEALASPTRNQAPPTSSSGAAIVFAPPSNVRESPTGAILCSVRKRSTINILGSTSATDGVWYYTDVCGRTGVIHSGQVRF